MSADDGAARVAAALRGRRPQQGPFIVGITGSVASGKSTFAQGLGEAVAAWPEAPGVEVVCTDGFLFPNADLDARGLGMRKGFPESYDVASLRRTLASARDGTAVFPGYSHVIYDIDPALERRVDGADVLIVEGLSLQIDRQAEGERGPLLDALVYLDAGEELLEAWFVERFMGLWAAAERDPASFYARFRVMDEPAARVFAGQVWQGINLPNLRDHIVGARDLADIVVRKGEGHRTLAVEG